MAELRAEHPRPTATRTPRTTGTSRFDHLKSHHSR
jgi:hypothetical protein